MSATKYAPQSIEQILQNESIAEFLERQVFVRRVVLNGNGHRSWFEPVIYPRTVACDLGDYAYDCCGTEQEEPADGAEYKFQVGRNCAESPYGGWTFTATAYREGNVVMFEIEQGA